MRELNKIDNDILHSLDHLIQIAELPINKEDVEHEEISPIEDQPEK